MKKILTSIASLTIITSTTLAADIFFTDDFTHGSTLNGNSIPGGQPSASSTSYDIASTKNATACAIAPNDLTMKLNAATTSGFVEAQALFATNPIALSTPGDYIDISVVFTNTGGSLLAGGTGSLLWIGLFNSGGSAPVPGALANAGLTTTAGSPYATGNCANWQGYAAQISSGGTSRTYTRPLQNGPDTTSANQELFGNNVGSGAFKNPAATVLATAPVTNLSLSIGGQYTLYLRLTLNDIGNLTISNSLLAGGTIIFMQQTNNITDATFLTASFDGLGIGVRSAGTSTNPIMDIASIQVTGVSTPITTPPSIDTQPLPVSVPSGASCAFTVAATGFGLQYQWHRFGTNLVNGGNISGATGSMLIISPADAEDVASGANGYYVTVFGTGGFSTNSMTNSLTLRTAADLVWSGSSDLWDLGVTPDWLNGANSATFNFGDRVTFDDTGFANLVVNFAGTYLSASSVTVNSAFDYVFGGAGRFAGPGSLVYSGPGHLTMNNANSYSGGTTISNANAFLILNNYNGLGTGPVTLAQAGGQMEITHPGGATTGINGDLIVADDFAITYDSISAFGAVLLGDLSGTGGKTLTINLNNTTNSPSRFRIYGVNTVYEGNLNLNDSRVVWSCYGGSGSQFYNGIISGSGMLIQRGNGTTILNGANTYSGGTTPTAGAVGFGINTAGSAPDSGPIGVGPLLLAPEAPNLTGGGNVFAFGSARTIANAIQYQSGTNNYTLLVGGTNAMTFSGNVSLNGNDGQGTPTNRIFQITNTALTTLSGVISGAGYGIVKTGNGTLALSNTETYTGPTLITNGTLQVNGQLGASPVTVATNATLSGIGTINGAVTVLAGGVIAPGNSIGTLTINNNLSLAGNLAIEIDKSGSPTSDRVVVSGTLNNTGTGTVTVTNLGSALAQGDTFTLFSQPLANGGSLVVTGGNVVWTNKLAVDGTIQVASLVSTTPTNITFSLSGNTLTLSWPLDHTGWFLQAQTNAPGAGISTNWGVISGSANANQYQTTINRANGSVYYRLVAP